MHSISLGPVAEHRRGAGEHYNAKLRELRNAEAGADNWTSRYNTANLPKLARMEKP